jgi:hypothetical protein
VVSAARRAELRRQGFLVLRGAVPPDAVEAAFRIIDDAGTRGLRAPVIERRRLLSRVPALRGTQVFEACARLAADLLQTTATRCSYDHLISKAPGAEDSDIAWHQDQAYQRLLVRMESLHFWIPRRACGPRDGGLRYVPGSDRHGLLAHVRAGGRGRLALEGTWVQPVTAVDAELERGDLCLHTPLTVHGSGPNLGPTRRDAWILHFTAGSRWRFLGPENLRGQAAVLGARLRRLSLRRGPAPDPAAPGPRRVP